MDSQPCPAFQRASTTAPSQKTKSSLKTLLREKTILISQGPSTNRHTHTHCYILTSNTVFITVTETTYFYLERPWSHSAKEKKTNQVNKNKPVPHRVWGFEEGKAESVRPWQSLSLHRKASNRKQGLQRQGGRQESS